MINIEYISAPLKRVVKVKKQRDGRYHLKNNSLGLNVKVETIEELEKVAKAHSEFVLVFRFEIEDD